MPGGTHQKCNHRRRVSTDVRATCAVDVSSQEVMHGDIPLAGEFQPVAAVPPIGIKMSVGETGDFRKGAEHVFEDDEEDEQEHEHEGEEQHRDRFREDETLVDEAADGFQAYGGFSEGGHDEFLRGVG